jgi:hypothetical protein
MVIIWCWKTQNLPISLGKVEESSMRRLCLYGLVLILITICSLPALAQEAPTPPTPPNRLALEVTFYPGRKPSYQPVPAAGAKDQWTWYSMLKRIESWQPAAEAHMIRAVKLIPRVEGDAARVNVLVMWGEKALENEKQIASYALRENESVEVPELKDFGIEPFGIKLVRLAPNLAPIPSVSLEKVPSLVLMNAVSVDATVAFYRLTLLNQSNKDIAGLAVDIMTGPKMEISGRPRGRFGEALIPAGKSYELSVRAPVRAEAAPGGFAPAPVGNHEVFIRSIVFADGTFEGESESATQILSFREGEKLVLPGLITCLDQAIKSESVDTHRMLIELEDQLDDVSTSLDAGSMQRLTAAFSQIKDGGGGLKRGVEIAAIHTKDDLAKSVHNFDKEAAQHPDPKATREWLSKTREFYAQWLARL